MRLPTLPGSGKSCASSATRSVPAPVYTGDYYTISPARAQAAVASSNRAILTYPRKNLSTHSKASKKDVPSSGFIAMRGVIVAKRCTAISLVTAANRLSCASRKPHSI
jgi:hypothetical protein